MPFDAHHPFGVLPTVSFGWAGTGTPPPPVPVRFATAEYVGAAGASPPVYQARVLGGIEIGQSVADAVAVGGRASLTVADVALDNADGALDAIARFGLAAGRPVSLRAVPVVSPAASDFGTPLASAELLFHGDVSTVDALGATARLAVADRLERLNTRLQAIRYDGSGELGGRSELKNLPKPVSLGERFNVAPVYLGLVDFGDGPLPTYQTHWRGIAGHTAVRERGTPSLKTEAKPGIGYWRDWPGLGCFQLGFTPDGDVTCDVRGDAPGGDYAGTLAAVLRRLLMSPGVAMTAADLDAAAWTVFDAALPGPAGWGIGTEEITALAAAEQMLSACGAWLAGGRDGLVAPAVVAAPKASPDFDLEDADLVSHADRPVPSSLSPTPAAVEVGWKRNWAPSNNLRESVQGGERDALSGPGQVARSFSSRIAGRGLPPRTLVLPGLWAEQADAQRRADALVEWLERGLRVRVFETDRYRNRIRLGLTGEYLGGRYGGRWSGVVVGWRERVPAARVEITMIG